MDTNNSDYDAYKDYDSVSEWYEAEGDKFPIQIAQGISEMMEENNMTFHQAFEHLVDEGAIGFIDDTPEEG